MARPVQSMYLNAIRMVNTQNSYYARRDFDGDEAEATRRIAESLGAHADEIVITRNATEAAHNLMRQYRGLGKGDAVLLADVDYPGFNLRMTRHAKALGIPEPRTDWEEVMAAVKSCHEVLHEMGAPRVATNMRLGTRTDKAQSRDDKIASVKSKLDR